MPRTQVRKRRSDAISRDDPLQASSPEAEPTRSLSPVSNASDNNEPTQTAQETSIQTLTKKLIRLALACEYSRLPLRRNDITQKIFKESNASHRLFKPVFVAAQKTLHEVFGMQLVELPGKEKTSLKDRRTQATQATQAQQSNKSQAAASANANKSWILTSTLPSPYKTNPLISNPAAAPTRTTESNYTALYTFILSLIYLNNSALSEAKLERYLKRVNADTYTVSGTLEKTLARMVREGYIDKRREINGGEESVEYVVGPRGKIEVGGKGVAGLIRSVYGFGAVELGVGDAENGDEADSGQPVKMERAELESRLKRSLGASVVDESLAVNEEEMEVDRDNDTITATTVATEQTATRPGRGRRRRNNDDDDDDGE